MRVESAMVMVVVACLGMRLVIVVVVMIVHRRLGMLFVVVVMIVHRCLGMLLVLIIMIGLGVVIVIVVMPGLLGMLFVVVIVTVLVVERDRLDAVGRHHAHAIEIRSVDQTVEPTFELQPVDDKDRRSTDGPRVGGGRLVDMRIPVGADERRDERRARRRSASPCRRGPRRWRPPGSVCRPLRSPDRRATRRGGRSRTSEAFCGRAWELPTFCSCDWSPFYSQASRWRRGKARPARPPTGPKTSDSAQARPATRMIAGPEGRLTVVGEQEAAQA